MISMEMGEEVDEGIFGERLTERKIIYDDISVSDYSWHCLGG